VIQIANILLTRKCNLSCSYCAISKNYEGMPEEYPSLSNYHMTEMNTEYVCTMLDVLKKHNPDIFVIFYGGEPMLRKDIVEIIKHSNDIDLNYTIITNNSDEVQKAILNLVNSVVVKGITSSVDPVIYDLHTDDDRYKKSILGFERLENLKKYVKDVVAEVTVTKDNVKHLYMLVSDLSKKGISSSITFIDISKNPYYDFSDVTDSESLIRPSEELHNQLESIKNDSSLDIHMKDELLPLLEKYCDSSYDCEIEKNVHNVTIDADGTLRLCLRIRGTKTAEKSILNYINSNGDIDKSLLENIKYDKDMYCRGCNWTCPIFSGLVENNPSMKDKLIHTDKRG